MKTLTDDQGNRFVFQTCLGIAAGTITLSDGTVIPAVCEEDKIIQTLELLTA